MIIKWILNIVYVIFGLVLFVGGFVMLAENTGGAVGTFAAIGTGVAGFILCIMGAFSALALGEGKQ